MTIPTILKQPRRKGEKGKIPQSDRPFQEEQKCQGLLPGRSFLFPKMFGSVEAIERKEEKRKIMTRTGPSAAVVATLASSSVGGRGSGIKEEEEEGTPLSEIHCGRQITFFSSSSFQRFRGRNPQSCCHRGGGDRG